MDKIFSARLDESVLSELEQVTHHHHMTKKKFLEEAIHSKAQALMESEDNDVWVRTCGAWKRKESAATLVKQIRTKMRKNFQRRHHL
jgi:hypothetical protein